MKHSIAVCITFWFMYFNVVRSTLQCDFLTMRMCANMKTQSFITVQ